MRRLFAAILIILCASACTTAVAGTPVADPRATRPSESTEPVTLTVMTPADQGFNDLLTGYQREHPDVTVRVQQTDSAAYYQKLRTMLAAGEPPDVILLGDEYRAQYFNDPALLADLGEVGPDVDPKQWLDWKYKGGRGADGTLRGYGLDISPYAMAYRTDLFAAAGLPTDPGQVGDLFKSWSAYFAAGDQYVQKTGKPWFASSAEVYTAMQNQVPAAYFDKSGQLTIDSNATIKGVWTAVTGAAGRGQSAKLEPFGPDWFAGFRSAAFATAPAPYWMLALIKSNSGPENAGKWAVAGVFPDGGANWGGSYLSVPAQSKHPEQAAALAAWLTSADPEGRDFTTAGTFPAQEGVLTSADVTGVDDDYFVSKGIGTLYAGLAREVPFAPYAAPLDSRVQTEAVWPALAAVEHGTPPDAGWQQAVAKAEQVR